MGKKRAKNKVDILQEKIERLERKASKKKGAKERLAELEKELKSLPSQAEQDAFYAECISNFVWAIDCLRPIAEQNETAIAAYESARKAEHDRFQVLWEPIAAKIQQLRKEHADYKRDHPFLAFWKEANWREEERKLERQAGKELVPPAPKLITLGEVNVPEERRGWWQHLLKYRSLDNKKFKYRNEEDRYKLKLVVRMEHVNRFEEWLAEVRRGQEADKAGRPERELRLRKRIERIKNAQGARARVQAAAAAHFDKTRELAVTVKRQLRDQVAIVPVCPYCGGQLGNDAEADHIHPVCLGGFSTPENMAFVCAKCNGTKHDRTLREFILSEGLNRDEVESRLTKLRKRF